MSDLKISEAVSVQFPMVRHAAEVGLFQLPVFHQVKETR